jgi:UTP--glucose-1-phosphate uridylyltransferase
VTDNKLKAQLQSLSPELRERLAQRGFDAVELERWAASLGGDPAARNRLVGEVSEVDPGRIHSVSEAERLEQVGEEALRRGELAVCVLAGGMATRMGGVVKALVDVLPGLTFLEARVAECARFSERYGASVPLWLMTSEPTNGPIREALGNEHRDVATFEQFVSLRLTPEGELFFDDEGAPSVYATGHGDLPDALRASGLLERFVADGGRYVWIENLDNLGASVDAAILGDHIESGAQLTVELVDKRPGDKGGGPVLLNGRPIIAEHFRLPLDFDADKVPVFNTNTFLVDARALAALAFPWTYLEVHKEVDGRTAIQFERLLGEMTMAIEPRFLRVPRDGAGTRFLPCKDHKDLEAIRPIVSGIARTRGFVA